MIEGRAPLLIGLSGEEGIGQIRALLGLGDLITNVNLENQGQIPNLPMGAVVETNARFSQDEVRPIQSGALPLSIHSIIQQHALNQEMIVQAALTGDKDLAFQAVYSDPASGLPLDEAWKMFNEMLEPSLPYLPGWKGK
jgi:alpha-galactosidase